MRDYYAHSEVLLQLFASFVIDGSQSKLSQLVLLYLGRTVVVVILEMHSRIIWLICDRYLPCRLSEFQELQVVGCRTFLMYQLVPSASFLVDNEISQLGHSLLDDRLLLNVSHSQKSGKLLKWEGRKLGTTVCSND